MKIHARSCIKEKSVKRRKHKKSHDSSRLYNFSCVFFQRFNPMRYASSHNFGLFHPCANHDSIQWSCLLLKPNLMSSWWWFIWNLVGSYCWSFLSLNHVTTCDFELNLSVWGKNLVVLELKNEEEKSKATWTGAWSAALSKVPYVLRIWLINMNMNSNWGF